MKEAELFSKMFLLELVTHNGMRGDEVHLRRQSHLKKNIRYRQPLSLTPFNFRSSDFSNWFGQLVFI